MYWLSNRSCHRRHAWRVAKDEEHTARNLTSVLQINSYFVVFFSIIFPMLLIQNMTPFARLISYNLFCSFFFVLFSKFSFQVFVAMFIVMFLPSFWNICGKNIYLYIFMYIFIQIHVQSVKHSFTYSLSLSSSTKVRITFIMCLFKFYCLFFLLH